MVMVAQLSPLVCSGLWALWVVGKGGWGRPRELGATGAESGLGPARGTIPCGGPGGQGAIWGFLVCFTVGDLDQDRYVNGGPKGPMGPMGPMGPLGPVGPLGPMGPWGPVYIAFT